MSVFSTLNAKARRLLFKRADYRAVFGTAEGKRVLADILATGLIGQSPVVPGDATLTMEQVGMQTLAGLVAKTCHLTDAEIIELSKERPYGSQSHESYVGEGA